ncbi:hypothetical protein CDCA_CDCA03G0967 [Cyanidium caldarium]|uniref:Uncharacterized protein n=1 Tax=Cyanidium caldarium TaxID=2771 RepID=A0AAV9IRG1_CYACA|nr:hypothetical protein CDCA_CDCA03G0967 [Cyanidium caldarium]
MLQRVVVTRFTSRIHVASATAARNNTDDMQATRSSCLFVPNFTGHAPSAVLRGTTLGPWRLTPGTCTTTRRARTAPRLRAAVTKPESLGGNEGSTERHPKRVSSGLRFNSKFLAALDAVELPDSIPTLADIMAVDPGTRDCEQCGGTGQAPCACCEGRGMITVEMLGDVSAAQCAVCRGRRVAPCTRCKPHVYSVLKEPLRARVRLQPLQQQQQQQQQRRDTAEAQGV